MGMRRGWNQETDRFSRWRRRALFPNYPRSNPLQPLPLLLDAGAQLSLGEKGSISQPVTTTLAIPGPNEPGQARAAAARRHVRSHQIGGQSEPDYPKHCSRRV